MLITAHGISAEVGVTSIRGVLFKRQPPRIRSFDHDVDTPGPVPSYRGVNKLMKIYRRKFHLATAAVAFIGVLSFLPITPASAGTHEAPSFQSAPSEVGDNGAPFQLTADPGHFQKTSRSDAQQRIPR